ncbi:MAG TPA: hypothetical protein VFJ88_02265 [Chthoniobacterales bacterium]|jgi:hypothetical protein|nr:hypothetical protein [Chthoniobacterales bacterium]
MARRRASSDTPLNQKQQELARLEQNLRKQMEDLQRMIEEAPRVAEEISRREREELLQRAHEGRERLDVSIALNDKRFSETTWENRPRRRRSLRKHRREGRLLFIVLVIALAIAVLWIATHLPF